VKKPYHIVSRDEKTATVSIEQFAKANGQLLLPLLELVSQARVAVDEFISSAQDHRDNSDAERRRRGGGADAGKDQWGYPLARFAEGSGGARRPPIESEAAAASS
jgi:hypothetical protein